MLALLEASIITSAIFTVNLLFKNKLKYSYYILILLLFWLVAFTFGTHLHANTHARFEIEKFKTSLKKEDKKFYQDKVKFHLENAERTFQDAKNKCWWLPSISEREKAKYCFTTAISYFTSSDPKSKLVAMVSQLLIQYGIDCLDEWNYIQDKLYWSEYHYEMKEFYQEVLKQKWNVVKFY